MSDLRPCPLCGGKAGYDKSYKISCHNCTLSVEEWTNKDGSMTNKEAVKSQWNNRPQLEDAVKALEEIEEAGPVDYPQMHKIAKEALSEIGGDCDGN